MADTVLLVRHASAGVRGTWPGDDLSRTLDDLGDDQAAALVEHLAAELPDGPVTVRSSRATRCVATVEPLAAARGTTVVTEPLLLEGADPARTLAWLEGPDAPMVACSHGDVIGGIVVQLMARGLVAREDARWAKGSTWVLGLVDGSITSARMLPPPTP